MPNPKNDSPVLTAAAFQWLHDLTKTSDRAFFGPSRSAGKVGRVNPTVLPATLTGQHFLLADDTPRILAAHGRQRIPPTTKVMQ
jgi:hypothetical protein